MTSEPGPTETTPVGPSGRALREAAIHRADGAVLGAIAIALGVGLLLVAFVTHDPATGMTFSNSPFSDEGFNALNARNLALLGRWSTDGWNLHLVNVPFSVVLALVFKAFGTGIVQARAATIAMVVLTILLLGIGLRRPFGRWPALLAALAYGTSTLVLYYGRLVYLEDLVALGLVAGALTLVVQDRHPVRWGVIGGASLAVAIAAKPSAAFAVLGMLGAVALVDGLRSPTTRRWLVAASVTIVALGAVWVALIWLPQRDAVAADLRIWAPITWPRTLGDVYRRVTYYLRAIDDDGAIAAAAPLIVLAGIGVVAAAARARRLAPDQRRIVAAAIGWFAIGMAVLLLASYRPNRYVVPLLPALSILGAAGMALVGPWIAARLPRPGVVAAGLLVAVIAAAPGLSRYLSWTASTSATLPAIQAQLASLVPAGSVVVGSDAPTLLMPAAVITIVPRAGIPGNDGDLYTSAGARWYLALRGSAPAIVTLPPGVWAARREVACVPWAARSVCLYEVP